MPVRLRRSSCEGSSRTPDCKTSRAIDHHYTPQRCASRDDVHPQSDRHLELPLSRQSIRYTAGQGRSGWLGPVAEPTDRRKDGGRAGSANNTRITQRDQAECQIGTHQRPEIGCESDVSGPGTASGLRPGLGDCDRAVCDKFSAGLARGRAVNVGLSLGRSPPD